MAKSWSSWRYANGGIPAATQCAAIGGSAAARNSPFSSSSEKSVPEIQEITRKLQELHFQRRLNIEVVDDTALIDTSSFFPKKKIRPKRNNKPRKDHWQIKKPSSASASASASSAAAAYKKHRYSREEMLSLISLHNVDNQRKKWSEVYAALAASVAAEYDGLVAGTTSGVYRRPIIHKPYDHHFDAAAMGKRSPQKISVH